MLGVAHQMQSNQSDPDQQSQTAPNNVNKISSGFTDYNAKWQSLIGDFRTHAPPPDCVGLANGYWTFLTGYAKVISQLQVALLNGDIGTAIGAQGAQKQINAQALAGRRRAFPVVRPLQRPQALLHPARRRLVLAAGAVGETHPWPQAACPSPLRVRRCGAREGSREARHTIEHRPFLSLPWQGRDRARNEQQG